MSIMGINTTLKSSALFPALLSGEPLELARGLVPLLAEHDREIDETRRVPPHVMEAISATGLPWRLVPKRSGGAGLRMRCQIEVTAELARGSAGAAWAFGLLSGVTGFFASLPQSVVQRMFLTGRELVCGVTMLTGTARRIGGRYVVDGTWPYASGSQFADWGMAGVKLLSEDGGIAGVGYAFMPFGESGLTIKDTWNVAGMRGSASNNMLAENVFVPEELVISNNDLRSASELLQDRSAEPRDRWPSAIVFPLGVIAPMLGAARNMLDRTVATLGKKAITFWDYPRQSESQVGLPQPAEPPMKIDSA